MGNVFPRRIAPVLPVATAARDVWIEDDQGRRYLDASGGAVVVNLGHGREEIARAVYDQILSYHYIHPTMFTTPVVETLATRLAARAPAGIDRFYFMSSGSEAVETAIKLARQIHLSGDQPQRFKVVARWKSYHGLTLGAMTTMGRTLFQAPYAPMLGAFVEHIPPPYCLRCTFGLTHPQCELRCAYTLEETFENLGPQTVSAFVAETVSGATLAAFPPPPGYWSVIRDICDRHGVLLILDEVMCGMGRTGRWFACQHYDISPDIVTLGKGLTGGSVPFSAVGVTEAHFEAVSRSGGFVHGGTYSHHPTGAAAANTLLDIIQREGLIDRVQTHGPILGEMLSDRLGDLPWVADVRGMGFLWGIELAADKKSLEPFPRSRQVTEKVWQSLFENGVIVYKATGLAGSSGDALVVAPPFVMRKKDMVTVTDAIRRSIVATLAE